MNAVSLLKKANLFVEVYSNVVGNPTGTNVEEGVEFFKKNAIFLEELFKYLVR